MREKSFPNRSPRTEHKSLSPNEPPIPQPGTRMLIITPPAADPMRLAEESIKKLERTHVKKGKRCTKKSTKKI